MTQETRVKQEAAEDVFYGQEVINWARWFVIFAGLALVMIAVDTTAELAIGITPVVGLMVVNFYLHGRRLIQKPANAMLIGVSSVIDLALITAVVVIGPPHPRRQRDLLVAAIEPPGVVLEPELAEAIRGAAASPFHIQRTFKAP